MTKIFTNGCFDILHAGHLKVLKRCLELSPRARPNRAANYPFNDRIIIAVNSDDSYFRLKGKWPINDQDTRAGLLEPWADEVIIFESDTPIDVIRAVKPDIIVKGGDYTIETVVGHELVDRVEIVPLLEGQSSSGILERIRNTG